MQNRSKNIFSLLTGALAVLMVFAAVASAATINDDDIGHFLKGTNSVDTINGNGGNDNISGGGGGDTIKVLNGNSLAALGFNSDGTCDSKGGTITAGNGNNSLVGCDGADTISAGNGNNQVSAKGGNDIISLGKGANRVQAGPGSDTVTTAKSKKVNKIDCGSGGGDIANVDKNDKVKNCETVNRK